MVPLSKVNDTFVQINLPGRPWFLLTDLEFLTDLQTVNKLPLAYRALGPFLRFIISDSKLLTTPQESYHFKSRSLQRLQEQLSISCQDLGQCRQQCCSPVLHASLYYTKVTADDRKCTVLDPGTSSHTGQTPAVIHYLGEIMA